MHLLESDDVSFFHEVSKGKILKSFKRKRSRARVTGGLNKNINQWNQSIKRRPSHKKKFKYVFCLLCDYSVFYIYSFSFNSHFMISSDTYYTVTLREKCPNKEFFLVCIFLFRIRKNSVFGHFSGSVSWDFQMLLQRKFALYIYNIYALSQLQFKVRS